ncbi:Protein kinase byr2 [Ceratobasidium theobromae]|uniref:Protein kinase byr2 n=1 Tax=Ceratobasidium theobromae TaxID=1582974 RepID=A0A5N5QD62_9AGAM|nr:Protein kinase byr2 [Ceratobasidium theobromae]
MDWNKWVNINVPWDQGQFSQPNSEALLDAIDNIIERGELAFLMNTRPAAPPSSRLGGSESVYKIGWPGGTLDFGEQIKRFEREKISVGKMADVWLCSSNDTSTKLVVKILRVPIGVSQRTNRSDPFLLALRTVIEERLGLQHKHIIELLGYDTSCGRYPGLVMKHCAGETLEDHIQRAPAADQLIKARSVSQILEGLEYLHTLPSPIAHGDLTPHNILVDTNGEIKILLVSFARLSANLPSHIQTGAPADDAISARYLSPELLKENVRPSPSSDIWSFGCVACWMFTQVDPYSTCDAEHKVVEHILRGHLPFTVEQVSNTGTLDIPWPTNGILLLILSCWNQDNDRRPSATSAIRYMRELMDRVGNE